MFEEKSVRQYDDIFVKSYKTNMNIYEVLEMIVQSDIPYVSVKVKEDQDVGLKYYNGEYSREKFLFEYEKMKYDVDDYTFKMRNDDFIRIIIETNSILLGSKNNNVDLNNIVNAHIKQK